MLSVPFLGAIVLAMSGAIGCGGGDDDLVISPAGPTVVEKGQTLQFSANLDGVTWSVEGGSGNGTISASGLYTPPAALPVGNPEISVLGSTNDDSDSAIVSLRTADTVTLGNEFSVSQGTTASVQDFGLGFMANRMAVGLGSVHEFAVFSGENAANINLFLAQSLDLGNYLTADNLSVNTSVTEYSAGVELDSELNPYVLFGRGAYGTGVRLYLTRSADQGETFSPPVPLLENADLDVDQQMAAMVIDGNETLHVVFSSANDTADTSEILYTRSTDGGATWSSPTTVDTGTSDDLIFPNLAVSPDGTSVYVTFFDGVVAASQFSRSTDSGATFSNPLQVTSGIFSGAFPFPDIALDPDGNIYLAVSDDPENDGTLTGFIRKSTDGGSTFGSPVPVVTATTDSQIFLNVAIDDLGRVDVVWTSSAPMATEFPDMFYARSLDGAATFGAPVPVVESDSVFAITRGLRHDESGRLYIQYILADDFMTGSAEIAGRRAE